MTVDLEVDGIGFHVAYASPNLSFPSLEQPLKRVQVDLPELPQVDELGGAGVPDDFRGATRALQGSFETRRRSVSQAASGRVVSACASPFAVRTERSELPWMRPSSFQVDCPWRTSVTRFSESTRGTAHVARRERAPRAGGAGARIACPGT